MDDNSLLSKQVAAHKRLRRILLSQRDILAASPPKPGEWKLRYTLAELEAAYDASGGACAICGSKPARKDLALDHCHETGKLRGLLCQPCNMGLGHFKDRADLLLRAVEYLRQHG